MTELLEPVAHHLLEIRARMRAAAQRSGRSPDSVQLLAVSKLQPPAAIEAAIGAAQVTFGENRVQEADAKIPELRARYPQTRWHMIGPLQRNKARRAVDLFDLIESVDRVSLAETLSRAAQARARTVPVLIQVNIDEEPQKAGVLPRDAAELLRKVTALPSLRVEGLMAIPRREPTPEAMRPAFARLRELAQTLRSGVPEAADLVELSMGMSADFEVAIEEGATWVRVGTALFGRRTPA